MRIILGAILSFFIWNLQSCKEVLPVRVVTASVDSTFVTTNIPSPQSKVVLFEEYTGASCPNCPDGHKIVKEILQCVFTLILSWLILWIYILLYRGSFSKLCLVLQYKYKDLQINDGWCATLDKKNYHKPLTHYRIKS